LEKGCGMCGLDGLDEGGAKRIPAENGTPKFFLDSKDKDKDKEVKIKIKIAVSDYRFRVYA
jgi:hypothetical protein